ncbi:hypothetical protein, partial [Streptomyces mangrovisoli]|uniref:hypothetical protein n=1 Tax=Streptomyces mangrovisoli TaxID=1428628 RepID=UPI0019CFC047
RGDVASGGVPQYPAVFGRVPRHSAGKFSRANSLASPAFLLPADPHLKREDFANVLWQVPGGIRVRHMVVTRYTSRPLCGI